MKSSVANARAAIGRTLRLLPALAVALLAAGCALPDRAADERAAALQRAWPAGSLRAAAPADGGVDGAGRGGPSAAALPNGTSPAGRGSAARPGEADGAASPVGSVADAPRFTFSAGDEFDLRVPDAPQFDQTLKVRPDGKVSLALVGTVHAQGRTPEDVQTELRERLATLAGARAGREYLLQPGDEFDVKFPYQPQLNEAVRVRPDGKVQLQMVGMVPVEGSSPEELQALLRERYARWLRTPELSVIVRSFATQNVRTGGAVAAGGVGGLGGSPAAGRGIGRAGLADLQPTVIVRNFQLPQVFVGGEVLRPGVLIFRPGLSLLQAVIEAGGHLPSGDPAQLLVLRRVAATGGTAESVEVIRIGFDAQRLRRPDRDVLLQPFDLVLLPKSDSATLADTLNQYVFNLVPFLRNSSFGFAYNIGARD